MITRPTLFILGAGASIPYGFPSGALLRQQICEGSLGISTSLAKNISTYFPFTAVEVTEFAREFRYSRIASIDSFLSKRPEFSELGKAAISTLLIPHEEDSAFENVESSEDWYFILWNALISGVHSLEDLALNKIKILTFNYDRSLERYLFLAIKHSFKVSDEVALSTLSSFKILHVYGSLGQYGLQDESKNRTYQNKLNDIHLTIASKSIKVIPEARNDDSIFKVAKEEFSSAEHVCILGFGFDQLNIERLGFKDIVRTKNELIVPAKIVTSVYGKTKAEELIDKSLFVGNMQFSGKDGVSKPVWQSFNGTSLETLRAHSWLLH